MAVNKKWYITSSAEENGVVLKQPVKVGDDDDSPTYALNELPDGIVIKDSPGGTTAWKIIVSNVGDLSAQQVTAE